MRKINILVLLLSFTIGFAQKEEMVQKEINTKLWKPFKAAFEAQDATLLNELYSEQVLRVTPNGIDTNNDFKQGNLSRFEQNKANEINIQLDFWFDSRHTNSHTSYEVGFYRMQMINAKETNTVYGQFHIVLQKIGGLWKITQDWDTATINGNAINAADFDKQLPMVFE